MATTGTVPPFGIHPVSPAQINSHIQTAISNPAHMQEIDLLSMGFLHSMDQNYDEILDHILEWEGGYSNDPGDSGGPTKYGITIHDARAYWKKNATAADVRAMPLSVAKDIYRHRYWAPIQGALLPGGVDYSVMDYGVNSGIARAAMVLQRIVGVPDDGKIGPITVGATLAYVHQYGARQLVAKINDERLAFLKSLSIWRIFGGGWGRRVAGVKKRALEMAA